MGDELIESDTEGEQKIEPNKKRRLPAPPAPDGWSGRAEIQGLNSPPKGRTVGASPAEVSNCLDAGVGLLFRRAPHNCASLLFPPLAVRQTLLSGFMRANASSQDRRPCHRLLRGLACRGHFFAEPLHPIQLARLLEVLRRFSVAGAGAGILDAAQSEERGGLDSKAHFAGRRTVAWLCEREEAHREIQVTERGREFRVGRFGQDPGGPQPRKRAKVSPVRLTGTGHLSGLELRVVASAAPLLSSLYSTAPLTRNQETTGRGDRRTVFRGETSCGASGFSSAPARISLSSESIPQIFLRPRQVEALYGLGQKFLAHARGRGDGPPFLQVGRKLVLYGVADLDAWLARHRRLSTSDLGLV